MKTYLPLLAKRPLPIPQQTVPFNHINGYDAEKLAAVRALAACGGEIRWSSRMEEGNKIDLLLSFENPFYRSERLVLAVQVKSGDSYGELTNDGFRLKQAAKRLSQRTTRAIVVIWVERNTNEVFWAYVHPSTSKSTQTYGAQHRVTPALRYDLARCENNHYLKQQGGKGVTLKRKGGTLSEKRKAAKSTYQNLEKITVSPVLGDVTISRVGWRHMFRTDRSKESKEKSIMVIPFLNILLVQKPTKLYHAKVNVAPPAQGFEIRQTEFILSYGECKYYDRNLQSEQDVEVIIKCIEEVRYPTDWQNNAMVSQMIERKVTVSSCYYK